MKISVSLTTRPSQKPARGSAREVMTTRTSLVPNWKMTTLRSSAPVRTSSMARLETPATPEVTLWEAAAQAPDFPRPRERAKARASSAPELPLTMKRTNCNQMMAEALIFSLFSPTSSELIVARRNFESCPPAPNRLGAPSRAILAQTSNLRTAGLAAPPRTQRA